MSDWAAFCSDVCQHPYDFFSSSGNHPSMICYDKICCFLSQSFIWFYVSIFMFAMVRALRISNLYGPLGLFFVCFISSLYILASENSQFPLFFNAASESRPVDPLYASGHSILFSDMYPYMLLSEVGQVLK